MTRERGWFFEGGVDTNVDTMVNFLSFQLYNISLIGNTVFYKNQSFSVEVECSYFLFKSEAEIDCSKRVLI